VGLTFQMLLRPMARLAGMHASRQTKAFLDAHHRTRDVQDRLLRVLLDAHQATDFGRDHHFSAIRTWDDFTRAVPIRPYEQLEPYVRRAMEGHTTALLPPDEPVLMFSRTSGTTGRPKYIPVTGRFLAHYRRGWNIFGYRVLSDHPNGWMRPIVQISSRMDEERSPAGLPCGAISGLLAATQKRVVRRMYVVPPAVAQIAEPQDRYYTTLRCAVDRDVAIITTANPSSTIKLIETGQRHAERLLRDVADGTLRPPGGAAPKGLAFRRRPNPRLARRLRAGLDADGTLLPRHFWNLAFLTNWTGGTLGLYLPRLRRLFDNKPVRDIGLLASEGRFSIPLANDSAAGVAEITANVLEFIPAAEYGRDQPPTLRPHEVEIGQEYFLVFSNFTGLFRYNLDDRVKVVDRLGDSPVFCFLSRGTHTANMTGEKITEHQVVEAMHRVGRKFAAGIERFVLQGCFADTPYYELRVDAADVADADAVAAALDAELAALNIEYQSKRSSGRLGRIQGVLLPAGTLQRAEIDHIRRRGGRAEQYKHKYLLTEVLHAEREVS